MNKKSQVCIGHLTLDDIYQEKGKYSYRSQMGGACLYSALGAALWSREVAMVSYVGRSYDYIKLNRIADRKKISIQYVKRRCGEGIKISIKYDEENRREFIPKEDSGNYYDWAPKEDDIPQLDDEQNVVFHISPIPAELQLKIVNHIHNMKLGNYIITLDPDIRDITSEKMELWEKIFRKIDYFLINESEMKKFLEYKLGFAEKYSEQQIKKICDDLGIKVLVLKRAEKGVIAIDRNRRCINIQAYPVECVDCTGAGDAFAGGFGYGVLKSGNLREAMIHGCISSSFAIETVGIDGLVGGTSITNIK